MIVNKRVSIAITAVSLLAAAATAAQASSPAKAPCDRSCAPMRAIVKPDKPITGNKKGLIILVDFADKKFTIDNPRDWVDSLANCPGYSAGRYRGSVADYFRDQSRGQLSLTFDVVGPVSMPNKSAYYGEKNAMRPDAHAGEMIATACRMAAGKANMADFDWNGDGEAEMVFIVYAGHGEHVSHDTNLIWPKQGTLGLSDYGKTETVDGIVFDTFACSCELNGATGEEPTGIAAICHEFSHCFGLPDLYDKYGIGYGMGPWSIMDTGMYNDDGYLPCGFTSYERFYSGWLTPIELTEPTSIKGMKPLEQGGEAYIIYNDANRDEFYMLENRQPVGWDAAIGGSGLLITHTDYNASEWRFNSVNSDDRHPRYYAFAADGQRDDDTWTTDAYPQGSNNSLTDTSFPPAKLYNANLAGTKKMGKAISGIRRNDDGTIDFDFMSPNAAVDEIDGTDNNYPVKFYNLQGREIAEPDHGVYIRKQGPAVTKIIR